MDHSGNRFATEPMLPLMTKMALPAIAAQLVNLLYNIVDRIYIGHIARIGTQALAGVGVCGSILLLISAFASFVGGGGAPIAAIELGKGNEKRARQLMNNGSFLLVVMTFLTMLPAYLFMKPLLYLVGASDATYPYARQYLSVYLTGTFFVMTTIGMNPFLNVQGHPVTAMVTVLIGAVLNIVLDPLFIFVLGMGVKGAAWATVISQVVSAVWILLFLRSDRASLPLSFIDMKPSWSLIRPILSLGISPFVMAITESIIGFVLNRGLAAYGDIHVSAMTIMQSCMQMISVPVTGFTTGAMPVISYNYGAGLTDRVKEGTKIDFILLSTFNVIMVLAMVLEPGMFARIFTRDKELIGIVKRYMPVFLTGLSIFGLQRACQNTFVALDQPKVSLFIALLRKIFLLVPLALILPHLFGLGVTGIYLAESIADATAATICTIIFVHRFPKILKEAGKK